MTEYVYLGKRVRDTGYPGLDSIREVRDIADAIIEDCLSGAIEYRTAMARMNLLELVVAKSFSGAKEARARAIIDKKREELMQVCS